VNEAPARPFQLDLPGDHVEPRPRVTAVRAPVVAEMADVGGGVCVRRAAAQAVLRVGRMLEGRARPARVVDPEDECVPVFASEIADLRVVAVQDEQGIRQLGDRVPPAGSNGLELAVAVELVAEEVSEQQCLRSQAARDLRQCALVHLEQPEGSAARAEQGGGDPGDEIRTRAVVRDPQARPQDFRHHRARRRLPVRGRDEHRPFGEPPRQAVDRARIQLPEQLSGQRRAATAAGHPGELAGDAERGGLEAERDRSAHAAEASGASLVRVNSGLNPVGSGPSSPFRGREATRSVRRFRPVRAFPLRQSGSSGASVSAANALRRAKRESECLN